VGPQALQPFFKLVNWLCQPVVFYTVLLAVFFAALAWRRILVRRRVAIAILTAALVFIGVSAFSPQFLREAAKADNVALWALVFLTGLCLWAGFHQAVRNDERRKAGLQPEESEAAQRELQVWPHLLYLELIVAAFAVALLCFSSVGLEAPLEQPANPANSPNPAKAPWYFVGLQELLVYFDPWIAGVLLPAMTVTGLMCLPYCDPNPEGVGHFSFERRRFAIATYLFGFLLIWVAPILVGTFLRGSNWAFFGLYEPWDTHKVVATGSINLSQFFWQDGMRLVTGQPRALESLHWLVREAPGLILLAAYFTVAPWLGSKVFKNAYRTLGFVRYSIVALHLLVMFAVPIKMYLRWALGLKYIVFVPEYFFDV